MSGIPWPRSIRGKSVKDMTREELQLRWQAYRYRLVPSQLDSARRKVAALESEARRLGLNHLLEDGNAA